MRKTIEILGLPIDTFTVPETLEYIEKLVQDGKPHYIVTPNPEFIMQSLRDANFRETIKNADLSLPDGVGILWAAKYLSLPLSTNPFIAKIQSYWQLLCTGVEIVFSPKSLTSVIPERVTGADMIWEISRLSASRAWGIFLVGAAPGVVGETAERLKLLNPRLDILGAVSGPPLESEESVIAKIKELQPKFVFLAFTAEKQLNWIRKYSHQLPGIIFIGVGGAFDFIAGGVAVNAPEGKSAPAKRAPIWMQDRGLEWFWRLLTQPWRRKRIWAATGEFMRQIKRYKLQKNISNK